LSTKPKDYFSKPTLCFKPFSGKVTHVGAGHNHSVYICDAKRVYCTGFNYYGQCGMSNTVDELLERYEEIEVPLESNEKIVSVSCGMNHNVLLTTHNRVLFWGNTTQNQFPNFRSLYGHDLIYTGVMALPLPLLPNERITKLKAYVNRTLVFTDKNRALIIGGEDASKQHGLPKINYVDLAADKFFEGKRIVDVSLGVWHTAVVVE
jgi:alpha-tubulin suppressor-like RCC1 family protein